MSVCGQELECALLSPHTNSLFSDIMWALTFEKKKNKNESMKKCKENKSGAQPALHTPTAHPRQQHTPELASYADLARL